MKKICHQHGRMVRLALCVLIGVVVLGCYLGPSAFAENTCGGASTSVVSCDENEGGIWHIVNLIIDIFSIGVGILAVVGIMVAGVQYLTSRENQEQARKARTRLSQIVIGIVLYAVLFAGTKWLLPGGFAGSKAGLKEVGSTAEVKEQEKKQEEIREKALTENP